MKTLNDVKILLLCVVTMALASCGDDNHYYTIQNSDDALCGKTWVEEYMTEDNELCRHQLEFTKVRKNSKDVYSGKETTIIYQTGKTNTETRDFTWEWIDNTMEGLILSYGAGDIKHFENVWVREHYLSGKLDGRVIVLTDITKIIK